MRRRGYNVDVTVAYLCGPPGVSATQSLIARYGGFWADANYPAALTMAAQPTKPDAACENAAAWTVQNSALITNQAGGVAGNCMRVTRDGSNNASAFQSAVGAWAITGNRFTWTWYYRGDGTYTARMLVGGGITGGTSSIANNWQAGATEQTCGGTQLYCRSMATVDPGYAEFDSLDAANLSITNLTPRFRSGDFAAATLANATAANQPWKSSTAINGKIVLQSADTDVLLVSTAANTLKFLHYGTAGALPQFALSWNVRVTSLAANTTLLRTYAAGTHAGVWIYVTTAGVITVTWYDAAGGVLQTLTSAAGAIAINTSYVVTAWADATSAGVIVNGADAIAATGMAFAPANSDPSNGQWLNGTATPVVGQSSNLVLVAGCASQAEALSVHREQAAEWGIAV